MAVGHEPDWLGELRQEALGSSEWAEISGWIQERVRAELETRGLGLWADLSAEEKSILLNEVGEEVRSSAAYRSFLSRLGSSLDDALLHQEARVHAAREEQLWRAKQEGEQDGAHSPPRLDLPSDTSHVLPKRIPKRHPDIPQLLEIAGEGACSLLRSCPENFHYLRVVGCRGFPMRLRHEVWKLQLRHAAIRNEYLSLAAEDQLNVFSTKHPEIAKSLRALLDAEFDENGLNDIQLHCTYILSFLHRRYGGSVSSPLRYISIVVVWALFSAEDRGALLDRAALVEMMVALLEETGYNALFDLYSFDVRIDTFSAHVSKVSELLQHADPTFHDYLASFAPLPVDDAVVLEETKAELESRLDRWWSSMTPPPSQHSRRRVFTRIEARSPWNLEELIKAEAAGGGASAGTSSATAHLFQLVLPMVQRLFAGMLDTLDGVCCIWDTLLLLGAQVLPHLCASYLIVVRRHASQLLPDPPDPRRPRASGRPPSDDDRESERQGSGTAGEGEERSESSGSDLLQGPSILEWEWALNSCYGHVGVLEVQAAFERHFLPDLQQALHIRAARQHLLEEVLPRGHGLPQGLTPALPEGKGGEAPLVAGAAARGRAAPAVTASRLVQTDGWEDVKLRAEEDRDLAALLQSNLEAATVAARLLSPRAVVSAADAGAVTSAAADPGRQQHHETAPAEQVASAAAPRLKKPAIEETVEVWYGGRIYSLVIPDEAMVAVSQIAALRSGLGTRIACEERLSSVADRVLKHPRNEELLSSVITNERKMPSPVARAVGSQLRPPMESNVDRPLQAALADKLPLLKDDYSKPMLRYDLVNNVAAGDGAGIHQVVIELYVAPLKAGDVVLGTEAVEEACREANILSVLTSDQLARMARVLEEYSRLPPRHEKPRRADHVVAVRSISSGAAGARGAGAAGMRQAEAAGKQSDGGDVVKGYALEVVSVDGPPCVGVDLKIERHIDQLVVDLRKRDASIRLPLNTSGAGRETGKDGLTEWDRTSRALVLEKVCAELCRMLKLAPGCFEASGIHVLPQHILVDINIHRQVDGSKQAPGGSFARAGRMGAREDGTSGDLSALQIYDMLQQLIAGRQGDLHASFLSSLTRVILRGQPHAVWKTKPFKHRVPRASPEEESNESWTFQAPTDGGQEQEQEQQQQSQARPPPPQALQHRHDARSAHPPAGSEQGQAAGSRGASLPPVLEVPGQEEGSESGGLGPGASGERQESALAGVKLYYAGVGEDGKKKTVGPFQFSQFRELVYSGEITLGTRVWRKPPGGAWIKLQKDEELMQFVAPTEADMMSILAMQK